MVGSAIFSTDNAITNRHKLQGHARALKKIQKELELTVRLLKPVLKDEAGQNIRQEYLAIRDKLKKSESRLSTLAKTIQQLSRQ